MNALSMVKLGSSGVTAGDTKGVNAIYVKIHSQLSGVPWTTGPSLETYVLLLLHPLLMAVIPVVHLMLAVEVAAPRRHLQALGRRGHGVVVGEVGILLLQELALLLLELLLLEVLDLGVDVGDGVDALLPRGGGHELGGRGGRRHGGVVVVHHGVAWRHHGRWIIIRVARDHGIGLLALAAHHVVVLGSLVVEAVDIIILHAFPVAHASRHVEELAKVIIGAHLMVVPVPGSGSHHGGCRRSVGSFRRRSRLSQIPMLLLPLLLLLLALECRSGKHSITRRPVVARG